MPWKLPVTQKQHMVIQDRRTQVINLLKQGYFQYEIAELLNVDPATVSRDVKALFKRLDECQIENAALVRVQKLLELAELRKTCWDRITRITSAAQGSRWIEEIRKIIELELKIVGGFAPERKEVIASVKISTAQQDAMIMAALGEKDKIPKELLEGLPRQTLIEFFGGAGEIIDGEFEECDMPPEAIPVSATPPAMSGKDKILTRAVKASRKAGGDDGGSFF
ncbi:MAG: helix-turn-helix domain-containing protein [Pseudomonadota bacterium]